MADIVLGSGALGRLESVGGVDGEAGEERARLDHQQPALGM